MDFAVITGIMKSFHKQILKLNILFVVVAF